MRNFFKVAEGIDVLPLAHALQRRPEFWGANPIRTRFPGSPHAEVDDVLLKFEAIDAEPDDPDLDAKAEAAERVFWPAWHAFPQVRSLVGPLMLRVGAYELTRVILTRLRPGGQIAPHADTRGKYANLPDIARYHLVVQGLPGSLFHCGDETVSMSTGEVWSFDAHQVHAVVNNSVDDRLHLLADMRLM